MNENKRSILLILIVNFLLLFSIYSTSYAQIETKIETYLEGGRRFFRFLPKGKLLSKGQAPTIIFMIRENLSGRIVWKFNDLLECEESIEEGIVEYGIHTFKECYVRYCQRRVGMYRSYKNCLDEVLFKPIPLNKGVEYILEISDRGGFKGKLTFVH